MTFKASAIQHWPTWPCDTHQQVCLLPRGWCPRRRLSTASLFLLSYHCFPILGPSSAYSPEQGQSHLYWDGSWLSGTMANPETERSSSHDEEHLQSCPFLSNWVTTLGPFSCCHPALVISLVCMLLVPWLLMFSHLLAYSVAFYSLLFIFCSYLHRSFTRTGDHIVSPLVLPLWKCLIPSDLHALSSLTHTMLSTGHYYL